MKQIIKEGIRVSVVIPTYNREQVLIDTITYLLNLRPAPQEIIVVDQTQHHGNEVENTLRKLHDEGSIFWIRMEKPSIPKAMNTGLLNATGEIVLFVDDDIIPNEHLISAHRNSHMDAGVGLVAGQVIQPWDKDRPLRTDGNMQFSSSTKQWTDEFMGGNFSVRRDFAMEIGGFDENFIDAAYRFEREFSERVIATGHKILFEPEASIRHLKVSEGGIRSYGNFLQTIHPSHAVGEYYYLLLSRTTRSKLFHLLWHPVRAVRTRHHLRRPWWIPVTLIAEFRAFLLALILKARGQKLLHS